MHFWVDVSCSLYYPEASTTPETLCFDPFTSETVFEYGIISGVPISNHDKPGRSPIVQWLRFTVHNHFREVIRVVVIACDERGNVSCYSFRMRCSITGFYGIPTARTCLAYMTTFRHGPLAEGGAVMELMTWAQLFNLYYVRWVWRMFMPASYVIMFNRYGAEFSHDEMA